MTADPAHAWDRFMLHERIAPGEAAFGNVRFAPDGESDCSGANRRRS